MQPIKKRLLIVFMIATLSLSGCCGGKSMHVKIKATTATNINQAINQTITDVLQTLFS